MRLVPVLAAAAIAALWVGSAHAATWCGTPSPTDRLPQVVPGRSVHLVYAIPSDGADRLATFGSTIETDDETIDAWWRGQDPTRTVRYDTFAFPCGPQADISEVRLSTSSADLTPSGSRFERVTGPLAAAGFNSPAAIYVVYLDAPDDGSGICGQGGIADPTRGPGYALVYVNACAPVPTSVVAAHEMTHALGAVPDGAPDDCPPPSAGHVCDTTLDLMYPSAGPTPLSGLVLDAGRNDYYGHSGGWWDVQDSQWLRHLDQPAAHLSVAIRGAGTVASDVPGISCAASCDSDWDGGTAVVLSAAPQSGERFVRWSGGCVGTTDECTLTLNSPTTVTAQFAPRTFPLTVSVTGSGGVLSSAFSFPCRKRCRVAVTSFSAVSLRAIPRAGWRFKSWSGTCHGVHATCSLPMSTASSARAVFTRRKHKVS